MFVACEIWCLADVLSVSPSSERTEAKFLNHNTVVVCCSATNTSHLIITKKNRILINLIYFSDDAIVELFSSLFRLLNLEK